MIWTIWVFVAIWSVAALIMIWLKRPAIIVVGGSFLMAVALLETFEKCCLKRDFKDFSGTPPP